MRRGEVYDAHPDPTEGSEQKGFRPVVIVSRDVINANLSLVVAAPCTTYRLQRRMYPSRVLIRAPDGGLSADSVALCEQARVLARVAFGADAALFLRKRWPESTSPCSSR